MPASDERLRSFHFSTSGVPEKKRFSVWQDFVAAGLPGIDVKPATDRPFFASVHIRILPDIDWGWGRFGGTLNNRPRAKDNDDFVLYVNREGMCLASQRGREVELQAGDACLISNSERSVYDRPTDGALFSLRVKRSALAPHIRNLEDGVARRIPRNTEGLRLLPGYLERLEDAGGLASPRECALVSDHIHDLVALILGASPEAQAIAAQRGLHAARTMEIKAHIEQNLARCNLTSDSIAQRFRISPRTIQRLFERDGTTLTEFVLDRRLLMAHRMLTNRRFGHLHINAIAYNAGFGDLSYFNRMFRRRFGATPGEIRSSWLRRSENR